MNASPFSLDTNPPAYVIKKTNAVRKVRPMNATIEAMMRRASVRRYQPDMPSDEVMETIVRAGRQAPFATQCYSLLLSREAKKHPFNAPLYFIVCVDFHKFDRIMARRG